MQAVAIYKNGELEEGNAKEILKNVKDGYYILELTPMYPKDSKQNRELFFYKLNKLSSHTGYTQDETYQKFKKDKEIGSLAGDPSIQEWFVIHKALKEWAWEQLEIII